MTELERFLCPCLHELGVVSPKRPGCEAQLATVSYVSFVSLVVRSMIACARDDHVARPAEQIGAAYSRHQTLTRKIFGGEVVVVLSQEANAPRAFFATCANLRGQKRTKGRQDKTLAIVNDEIVLRFLRCTRRARSLERQATSACAASPARGPRKTSAGTRSARRGRLRWRSRPTTAPLVRMRLSD